MGRKYDTRNTGRTVRNEGDDGGDGVDRRVPDGDRGRVQQRLNGAIEAVREDGAALSSERTAEGVPDDVRDEHRETLDRMAGMLDAQRGHVRADDDDDGPSVDGDPMVSLPGDDGGETSETTASASPSAASGGDGSESGGSESEGVGDLFDDDDSGFLGESDPFEGSESDDESSAESSDDGTDEGDRSSEAGTGEVDADDDEFSDDPVGGRYSRFGAEGDSSPAELAHEYLAEGAVADRHRDGGDEGEVEQRAVPPDESGDERIGGWDEYDPNDAQEIVSLAEGDEDGGRTQKYMDRVVLDEEADGTDTAFVTHYREDARPDVDSSPPRKRYGRNQMAMYAFCDAVGVDIPRHTYDRDGEWVAAYGVDGRSVSDLAWSSDEEEEKRNREIARKVDRDEFKDQMAVQILGGNNDLHQLNVHVDDGGGVHCIDLDLSVDKIRDLDNTAVHASRAAETSEKIARARGDGDDEYDEEFAMSGEEIAERAQEIAVSIHNSGDTDRIAESVAEYDEEFPDCHGEAHENIRENIELFVDAARDGRTPNHP